jgi:hypothetical protein
MAIVAQKPGDLHFFYGREESVGRIVTLIDSDTNGPVDLALATFQTHITGPYPCPLTVATFGPPLNGQVQITRTGTAHSGEEVWSFVVIIAGVNREYLSGRHSVRGLPGDSWLAT